MPRESGRSSHSNHVQLLRPSSNDDDCHHHNPSHSNHIHFWREACWCKNVAKTRKYQCVTKNCQMLFLSFWREGRVKGRLIWNLLVICLSFQVKIWLRSKVDMSDEIRIQMDLKDGEGWTELQLSFLSDRYLEHNAGLVVVTKWDWIGSLNVPYTVKENWHQHRGYFKLL